MLHQQQQPWDFKAHSIPSLHLSLSQVHQASFSSRPDILSHLLSRASPQHRQYMVSSIDPHTLNTPFLWACMCGDVVSCELLLRAGANIFSKNREGKNGLHLAVASGEEELVRKLVKSCRKLCEDGDEMGATPLHYASVVGGEGSMVEVFLQEGVSFLVRDEEGDCPLHWACRESLVVNVRKMVEREAFLKDVVNCYGETAVELACRYQEKEICVVFGVEKYCSPVTTFSSSSSSSSSIDSLLYTPSSVEKKNNLMFFENNSSSCATISNLWGFNSQVSLRC